MMTTNAEQVAANVRAEMARHRVTQAQLATVLGLHQMSVSRRLNGEVPFDVNELVAVADYLGVDPAALLPERVA
jgi:transcriptional regulator with XRE-family HTH domain